MPLIHRVILQPGTVTVIFVSLLLAGCGSSDDSELTRYIDSVKSKGARPIAPIPVFEPLEKFSYPENEERRNPFKPIAIENQSDVAAPNINRPKQPLEAFALDSLKFVGVLELGRTKWALIRQSNGMVSRVRPGDYMGKHYGQVLKISNDTIDIEETVQVNGLWEKKKITMNMHEAN